MARPNYGPGEHCAFDDFPQKITVVVDELLASNSGLFDLGQSVVLQQTPLSGQEQGNKIVGSELPEKQMIYTDTGDDSSFNLKVSYYGWGEFYLLDGEDYYSLDITKGMSVQAGDWSNAKLFETVFRGSTKIPSSKDLNTDIGETVNITVVESYDFTTSGSEASGFDSDSGDGDTSTEPTENTDPPDGYCDEPGVVGCYNRVGGPNEPQVLEDPME